VHPSHYTNTTTSHARIIGSGKETGGKGKKKKKKKKKKKGHTHKKGRIA
jgi:hypothetical protein